MSLKQFSFCFIAVVQMPLAYAFEDFWLDLKLSDINEIKELMKVKYIRAK